MRPVKALKALVVFALLVFAATALAQQVVRITGTDSTGVTRTARFGTNGAMVEKFVERTYGSFGDSTTHACSNPSTAVTLTGGKGVTYRVYCVGDAWLRLGTGNTAAASAPSTPFAATAPEYFTFTSASGADPVVNCFAAAATTCIYTPMAASN